MPPLHRPRGFALALIVVVLLSAPPRVASPQSSGQALEQAIVDVLKRHGFLILRDRVAGPRAPDRLAWRDVAYTTRDGGRGRVDFVLRASAFARPVWVAAMRSPACGSLDARLAGLPGNAAVASADVRVVLVVDGGGCRRGAVARAARLRAKPVEVMTLAGFRDWLARRLNEDEAPFGADAAPGSGYLADTVRE